MAQPATRVAAHRNGLPARLTAGKSPPASDREPGDAGDQEADEHVTACTDPAANLAKSPVNSGPRPASAARSGTGSPPVPLKRLRRNVRERESPSGCGGFRSSWGETRTPDLTIMRGGRRCE